ncbi:restriction endonuclease subunit S [Lactococcus petauri]|uniref:restriction endonuclease subunit S n=1 Tax=Lactococcus petauri TaxID=1940789 RepID=UPI003A4DD89F
MSKKSPQLRFEGFTDDWEERRLSEVLRERNNQQPQSMEYPLVSFTVENGVTPKTDRYEREQLVVGDKSSKKYKVTVLNDIVYNPANLKFGAISRNKYGNAVFSPIYVTFSVNNDVTMPEFIEMFITRKDFIKRALKYQQGTVYERQSVSPENLLSMNLYLPGKLEQEKIGTFFKQLDDTIALHQRKLDLLKEQKKGFLQKMFPKNGAKVPELRFAGFADDWEERKFEDLLDSKDGVRRGPFGSALKKEFFVENSEYVVYEQQNAIYDNYHTRYKITKEKFDELSKFKLNPGDFIMSGAGTIGRISRVPDGVKLGVFNQALIRFRINPEITDSEYFIQFVRADFMQKNLTGANPGSAITNLVPMSEVKKWEIKAPHLEEQEKIGSFFAQLDNTIALHQRKLDLLKEQKKGFLQKMFV